ncbi:CDP-glycerol glycerophosphotransferase family protein [Bacillus sp. SL00103]
MALYAPTFRDGSTTTFFGKAIPDMDKLVETLKQNNMLMIFKMHYLVNDDYQYNLLKKNIKIVRIYSSGMRIMISTRSLIKLISL